MSNGRCKVDMPHSFTSNPRQGNFNSTFVTDNSKISLEEAKEILKALKSKIVISFIFLSIFIPFIIKIRSYQPPVFPLLRLAVIPKHLSRFFLQLFSQ